MTIISECLTFPFEFIVMALCLYTLTVSKNGCEHIKKPLIYQPVLVAISRFCPHSEVVDKEFMAACYYLKDRRNEVNNPNKEMVRTSFITELQH